MARLEVQKTYKLYIGGAFPRTESGRSYAIKAEDGTLVANMCLGSRKDIRNAVVAARKAQGGWAAKSAFNRSQILYRMAEMLETRSSSFEEELVLQGHSKKEAIQEVAKAVDILVYYAGWCDKYQAVFSSVNPVASSHFNFSVYEPMGVVAAICPEDHPLLGVVSLLAPLIAGGNSVVLLASEHKPLSSIAFAEIVHTSDVPKGVINIITGNAEELIPHFYTHMDINAVSSAREISKEILKESTSNVKRVLDALDWQRPNPYHILKAQELKTTWHPIQSAVSGAGGY